MQPRTKHNQRIFVKDQTEVKTDEWRLSYEWIKFCVNLRILSYILSLKGPTNESEVF